MDGGDDGDGGDGEDGGDGGGGCVCWELGARSATMGGLLSDRMSGLCFRKEWRMSWEVLVRAGSFAGLLILFAAGNGLRRARTARRAVRWAVILA